MWCLRAGDVPKDLQAALYTQELGELARFSLWSINPALALVLTIKRNDIC